MRTLPQATPPPMLTCPARMQGAVIRERRKQSKQLEAQVKALKEQCAAAAKKLEGAVAQQDEASEALRKAHVR